MLFYRHACVPSERIRDGRSQLADSLLQRKYKEGEKLSYHMKASNRERERTLLYEIQADGNR